MAKRSTHDIKRLEKKVSSISKALANLNNADDFRRLILEWRRPGWTTPAEFRMVATMLDHMSAQVATLADLKGGLLAGSRAVTRG